MATARRHLKPVTDEEAARLAVEQTLIIVDPKTGEQIGTLSDYLQPIRDELAGAETDVRSWRTRFANLKRDRKAEAEEEEKWPVALRVFTYWRTTCNHPNSTFDLKRYEQIAAILEQHKGGPDKLHPFERAEQLCKLAIDGAAYDPATRQAKNGVTIRYDSIDLIFRSADKFESFVNRAPKEKLRAPEPPPAPEDEPPPLTLV